MTNDVDIIPRRVGRKVNQVREDEAVVGSKFVSVNSEDEMNEGRI
jgi:hypothetical protein